MSLSTNDNATSADDGCRCMDDGVSFGILNSLEDRSCTTANNGNPGIRLRGRDRCVPLTYGATCAPHDATYDPDYCHDYGIDCYRPWCYVADRDSCMMANSTVQRVYRSTYITAEDGIDLYWSYTVCDGLDDWGDTNMPKETLGGVTIQVCKICVIVL